MEVDITDSAGLMAHVVGLSIVAGEVTEDGMHLRLSNGRFLVCMGEFVVAVVETEKPN